MKSKEQWAKMLAGQGVQSMLEENDIKTEEEMEKFIYGDCEAHEILREICSFYFGGLNDPHYDLVKDII